MINTVKFTRSLDPNKANDHGEILILMLKLRAMLISKLLQTLYKSCLDDKCIVQMWKKANIVSCP